MQFGLWELALKVLDERGDMADIVAYNSALHALAKAGQWEQAVVLLDRMEAVGGGAVRACRIRIWYLQHRNPSFSCIVFV